MNPKNAPPTVRNLYDAWWREQTRKGDPAHNPWLEFDAFAAGYEAGRATDQPDERDGFACRLAYLGDPAAQKWCEAHGYDWAHDSNMFPRLPVQPPAYHVDPTGTTREPPHCPTCGCGATAQPSAVQCPHPTGATWPTEDGGWRCADCGHTDAHPETQPGAPGFDGADLWNATCPRCNGGGTEIHTDYTNMGHPIHHVAKCGLCDGTGRAADPTPAQPSVGPEFCPHCGSHIPPRNGEAWGTCCLPYQETHALREARQRHYDDMKRASDPTADPLNPAANLSESSQSKSRVRSP